MSSPTSVLHGRGSPWRWLAALLVVLAVYVALLVFYYRDDQRGALGGSLQDVPRPRLGALVTVTPRYVDAGAQTMTVGVALDLDPSLVNDSETPKQTLAVTLGSTLDGAPLIFPAGQPLQTKQAQLVTAGFIRGWPFDRYAGALTITASLGATGIPVPVNVETTGAVQGWDLTAELVAGSAPQTATSAALGRVVAIGFHRSLGIVLFGSALVVILIMLPGLGLYVAVRVYLGRQRMEPAFLSWIAGMLFASIPIRNFLPGSPPPGSWVDIAIVLWVIIALMAAFLLVVLAWSRQAPVHERARKDTSDTDIESHTPEDSAASTHRSAERERSLPRD